MALSWRFTLPPPWQRKHVARALAMLIWVNAATNSQHLTTLIHYLSVTLHALRFAQLRLKGNGGANPQLSRSCKFLYYPRAFQSTAQATNRPGGKAPGVERSQKTCHNSRKGGNGPKFLGARIMRHQHNLIPRQRRHGAPSCPPDEVQSHWRCWRHLCSDKIMCIII